MGFHICEYCVDPKQRATSSGDVYLTFASGNSYMVPDMIVHYIVSHQFRPPQNFIEDVMDSELISGHRRQTKGMPVQVGYLHGEYQKGDVPTGFVYNLTILLKQADEDGNRLQTRGIK